MPTAACRKIAARVFPQPGAGCGPTCNAGLAGRLCRSLSQFILHSLLRKEYWWSRFQRRPEGSPYGQEVYPNRLGRATLWGAAVLLLYLLPGGHGLRLAGGCGPAAANPASDAHCRPACCTPLRLSACGRRWVSSRGEPWFAWKTTLPADLPSAAGAGEVSHLLQSVGGLPWGRDGAMASAIPADKMAAPNTCSQPFDSRGHGGERLPLLRPSISGGDERFEPEGRGDSLPQRPSSQGRLFERRTFKRICSATDDHQAEKPGRSLNLSPRQLPRQRSGMASGAARQSEPAPHTQSPPRPKPTKPSPTRSPCQAPILSSRRRIRSPPIRPSRPPPSRPCPRARNRPSPRPLPLRGRQTGAARRGILRCCRVNRVPRRAPRAAGHLAHAGHHQEGRRSGRGRAAPRLHVPLEHRTVRRHRFRARKGQIGLDHPLQPDRAARGPLHQVRRQ